jgi:hypothetical protein
MTLRECARAPRAGLVLAFSLWVVSLAAAPPAPAARSAVAHLRTHGPDPAFAGMRRHASAHAAADEPGEPTQWCGQERSTDDTSDELDNGSYRYHAVYLVAADAPDRFTPELATQIQSDAFGASALLERLYGRAIRFDIGTSCGTGYLDVSVVHTSLSKSRFARAAREPDGTLDAVSRALRQAGFPILRSGDGRRRAASLTQNYIVWLEAPVPRYTCGVADVIADATRRQSNWNNYGGKVGVVFRNGDSFCGADAVRHEIGHTLGALQPNAPHAFDGSHCDDAFEDTMCYPSAPVRGSGVFEDEFFDYGNDDYWDPPGGKPLGWWTVNLNRFVCPDATCNTAPPAVT